MAIQSQGLLGGGGTKGTSKGATSFAKPTVELTTTSGKKIYPDTGTIPWMRYLYIEFINESGKVFSIGGYDDSLAISVEGTKTLAAVGDTATITIYNLPMLDSLKLIQQGYTKNVRIYCGYYNTSKIKVFDGGVTYTEEGKNDKNTSVLKLECANRLISDRLQTRISLPLNSGLNMYRAIQEVEAAFGVSGQIEIDDCLNEDSLKGDLSRYDTLRGWIEAIIDASSLNRNYAISTNSKSSLLSVKGYKKIGSGDIYVINTRDVNLQGFPTISSDGLKIVLSPIYDMNPGDIISIDNTIQSTISMLNSSNSGYLGNKVYLDKDGLYNIRQMTYDLSNRSDEFNFEVLAMSRTNFMTSMLGGSK